MIIDLILNRKDEIELGEANGYDWYGYIAKDFYNECVEYSELFNGIGDEITKAMDYGTEEDVKAAICDYILNNGYSEEIIEFVNKVNWLKNDCIKLVTGEKNSDGFRCARIYNLDLTRYYLRPLTDVELATMIISYE